MQLLLTHKRRLLISLAQVLALRCIAEKRVDTDRLAMTPIDNT